MNIAWSCHPSALGTKALIKNLKDRGRSKDGRGIGRGDHFLFYKFIERTTERWTKFTKQLLIASRGHQAPRKAAHCLRRLLPHYSSTFIFIYFYDFFSIREKKLFFFFFLFFVFLFFFFFFLFFSFACFSLLFAFKVL